VSVVGRWLRAHDPGYLATRRATRAALIMPANFALADKVIGNPVLATFAAFGSFAMLLLVDFSGPIKDRVLNQAALGVACAVLISLGTLASRTTWLAAASMAIVAFVILFAGVVSSVLAGATTALLLSYILPVSLAGPASSIPDRIAGWGLAAAVSLPAIAFLWPSPARNRVRAAAIAACRGLADRIRADVIFMRSDRGADAEQAHNAAIGRAHDAVAAVQDAFFATPYRPTGLTTDDRAVIRLVDELRWLDTIVLRAAPKPHAHPPNLHVSAAKTAAADVLERAAELLERPAGPDGALTAALERMRQALGELEQTTLAFSPSQMGAPAAAGGEARAVVSSLDPSFRAQELSFVSAQIAANAQSAAAATRRSWVERLLGHQPEGFQGPWTAARERAASYLGRDSLWLRNSLRGAAALGLAVLVADLTSVQHAFWVAFGTLSVLRSNALATGQSIVRALAGTAFGFAVGGVVVYLIGTNTTVLWVLLPFVVLLAGLAPAAISFAAGQAAFTLTLLILFNLIVPAGWKIGLVRVEDVALGGAVSLVVGLLFWPRGARAALGRALARAYTAGAHYLAAAVLYGVGRSDSSAPHPVSPHDQALAAVAASRRLDDTFRGFLAERGSKRGTLAEMTSLVTGVTGVRLAGDAVLDLWDEDGAAKRDGEAASRELSRAATRIEGWYDSFAASLIGRADVPTPLPPDQDVDGTLAGEVTGDLDPRSTATAVRVIWTGDHLDAVRRLGETLVEPATAARSREERGSVLSGLRGAR
jgi:uncharacterized membrane protein YccC